MGAKSSPYRSSRLLSLRGEPCRIFSVSFQFRESAVVLARGAMPSLYRSISTRAVVLARGAMPSLYRSISTRAVIYARGAMPSLSRSNSASRLSSVRVGPCLLCIVPIPRVGCRPGAWGHAFSVSFHFNAGCRLCAWGHALSVSFQFRPCDGRPRKRERGKNGACGRA